MTRIHAQAGINAIKELAKELWLVTAQAAMTEATATVKKLVWVELASQGWGCPLAATHRLLQAVVQFLGVMKRRTPVKSRI